MPTDEIVDFTRQRQREEDARLLLLMNERADHAEKLLAKPAETPLGPEKPTVGEVTVQDLTKRAMAPVAAGGKAVLETGHEGLTNFIQGVMSTGGFKAQAVGSGQMLLGALQLLGALPAGAGAAAQEAFAKFAPGMESAPAIKGGQAGEKTAAGMIRATLAAPSLALDPKLKAVIEKDPQAVAKMLNEDITYGELMNIVAQFASVPLALRGLKAAARGRGGAEGAPAPPEPPPPPGSPDVSARTPGPYAPGTHTTVAPAEGAPVTPQTMADLLRSAWGGTMPGEAVPRDPRVRTMQDLQREAAGVRGGQAPAGQPEMTLDLTVKRPYEEPPTMIYPERPPVTSSIVDDLGRRVDLQPEMWDPMVERERLRALERTRLSAPSAAQPEPAVAPSPPQTGPLGSAVEQALARSEELLAREWGPMVEAEFATRQAAAGARPAPEVAITDSVSYRGQRKAALLGPQDEMLVAKNPDGQDVGFLHLTKEDNGFTVRKVEVAPEAQRQGIATALYDQAEQRFGPRLGSTAQTPEGAAFVQARSQRGSSQRGALDPGLLARMAIGAVAGGATGDTAEEILLRGAAGMVGGAVARRLSSRLSKLYEGAREAYQQSALLADEAGALRGTATLPNTRRAMRFAKSDVEGADWYHGTPEELQRSFPSSSNLGKRGVTKDADLMADLLTVTSPGIRVEKSVDLSLEVLRMLKDGKTPQEIGATVSPGGLGHTKIKNDIVRLLQGDQVDQILGPDALNLRNFNKALKGDLSAVVVDRWMWRLFYPEQWRSAADTAKLAKKDFNGWAGTTAQYRAIESWITKTAKTLELEPAELQAKLWVAIKIAEGDIGSLAPFRDLILQRMERHEQLRFPGMNEQGQVDLETALGLTQMIGGGLVGGAMAGDTPEAKIAGVLAGAIGGRLAGKLAPKLATLYRESGLLSDETGAFDLSRFRAKPAVQKGEDFQPNYERIDAETAVTRTMKNVHRAVADRITEAMQKPTSHDETTKAAWELIRSGKVTPETVLNNEPVSIDQMPAYGKAVRDLSVGAAAEATRVADAVLKGEPVAPGELRQALGLSGELATKARSFQTRGGQTVEAFKIKAEDPMLRGSTAPARLAELGDRIAPSMSDLELAQLIMADASPARVQAFTSALSILPEAVLEFMYGSMFSGLTIFRNVLGNFVMQPAAIGARAFAAGIADVKEGLGFRQASRVQWSEPVVMLNAWWNETGKQLMLLRSWKDWQEHAASMGKLQETHSAGKIAALADALPPGPMAEILRGVGTVVRKPLEVMNGTDASARAVARNMEIGAQAQNQAATEGRLGADFAQRAMELEQDPSQFTGTARRAIAEFEMEQTFTKDLEGRIGSALQAGPANEWANLAYRSTVFPVFRTAVRVAEAQLEYSGNPALTLLAKRFREDWWAGGRRRQIAEGKMLLGGTMFAAFTYLALNDWVTGSAPDDPKKRAIWGKPEISFWDPVSGKYRSYKGMEPLTGWIRNAADMVQYAKALPEADYLQLFGAHVLVNFNNLESENWWLGLSDISKVIRGTHGKDSQVEAALDVIRKRLALWSPGFLAEVEKGLDPGVRRSQPSGAIASPAERELEALIARYKTRTPLFSTEKDELGFDKYPIARDPLTGQHIVQESWPFMIFGIQPDKRSRARDEIDRLQPPGVLELPDHIGGGGDKGGIGLNPPKIAPAQGVLLGRNEKDRWIELMTQSVKDVYGKHLMDSMEALVVSPEYLGPTERPTSDFRKRELLAHKWHWFRDQAEHALLQERPELFKAVMASKAEPRIQRQSPTDQPGMRKTYESLIQSLSR